MKHGLNGTYVSVEPFHLFRYLDEQMFRYNNPKGKTARQWEMRSGSILPCARSLTSGSLGRIDREVRMSSVTPTAKLKARWKEKTLMDGCTRTGFTVQPGHMTSKIVSDFISDPY